MCICVAADKLGKELVLKQNNSARPVLRECAKQLTTKNDKLKNNRFYRQDVSGA